MQSLTAEVKDIRTMLQKIWSRMADEEEECEEVLPQPVRTLQALEELNKKAQDSALRKHMVSFCDFAIKQQTVAWTVMVVIESGELLFTNT